MLSLSQRRWYVDVGLVRTAESRRQGLKGKHGYNRDDPLAEDIAAAGAELFAAVTLGVSWLGGIGTFKDPDIGDRTQVRHTDLPHGRLIVRPDDPVEHIYVLVTGKEPDFVLPSRFWMWGHEVRRPEFLYDGNGRPLCWMAPQSALHPLSELEGFDL